MRWIPILLLMFVFVSCTGPHDTPLPNDISKLETIKPAVEKLSPEERELIAGYIVRHTASAAFGSAFGLKADPIPDGMTIGKAISEQRAFIQKQKTEEALKKAEREKVETARKALADQMAQVLSVRLTNIQLHKASYQDFDVQNYVKLAIEFDNKGTKTITGLKGIATFKDKFGDTVSVLPIKIEQQIPAGSKVTINLSKRFNQFDTEDRALANLDAATTNFTVSPEIILFDDGSKFEAPKAKD